MKLCGLSRGRCPQPTTTETPRRASTGLTSIAWCAAASCAGPVLDSALARGHQRPCSRPRCGCSRGGKTSDRPRDHCQVAQVHPEHVVRLGQLDPLRAPVHRRGGIIGQFGLNSPPADPCANWLSKHVAVLRQQQQARAGEVRDGSTRTRSSYMPGGPPACWSACFRTISSWSPPTRCTHPTGRWR